MRSPKLFLAILLLHSTFNVFSQHNIIDAKKLLTDVLNKNGYTLGNSRHFEIEGKGNYFSDGHLFDPEKLWKYDYSFSLVSDLVNNSHKLESTFKSEKNETSTDKKLYIANDEFTLNPKDSSYTKTNEINKWEGLTEINRFLPQLLISHVLANFDKLSVSAIYNNGFYTINFKDLDNKTWDFTIQRENLTPINVSTKYYHYLIGDVAFQYCWKDYKTIEGINFPTTVIINDRNFTNFQYKQTFKIITHTNPELTKTPIEKNISDPVLSQESRIITRDSVFIQPIAKNIYTIELPQTNNRLLVAEFKDYLFLLEGSYHSKNGDLIISILKEKFPNKPVRYGSFSHCHTQYIGFARSLCSVDATIVSTEGNRNYIKRLCSNKHQQRPDLQESIKSKPKFIALSNNIWKVKDEFNELEIHNIGPNHTNEYSAFYFPEQKILFVGDLCWVSTNKPIKLSEKNMKMYESIVTKLNLDFRQLYISWPLKGYEIETIVTPDALNKAYQQTLKPGQ